MSTDKSTSPEISENTLQEIQEHLDQIKSLAYALLAALESKRDRIDDPECTIGIKATQLIFCDDKALLRVFASSFAEEFYSIGGFLSKLKTFPDVK
jgi:hypothetical protein